MEPGTRFSLPSQTLNNSSEYRKWSFSDTGQQAADDSKSWQRRNRWGGLTHSPSSCLARFRHQHEKKEPGQSPAISLRWEDTAMWPEWATAARTHKEKCTRREKAAQRMTLGICRWVSLYFPLRIYHQLTSFQLFIYNFSPHDTESLTFSSPQPRTTPGTRVKYVLNKEMDKCFAHCSIPCAYNSSSHTVGAQLILVEGMSERTRKTKPCLPKWKVCSKSLDLVSHRILFHY